VNKYSLLDKLVKMRFYDLRFLVDVYVSSDPKNPSKSILRVKQPHNFFSKELYNDSNLTEAYKTLLYKVTELMSSLVNSTRNHKEDVNRMFELEKEFAMVV
jgi:predicted metalloendopeptidase